MATRKTYTEAEKEAYKRGLAAAKKRSGTKPAAKRKPRTRKAAATTTTRKTYTRKPRTRKGKGKARSGCYAVDKYKLAATGEEVQRPKISAWRIDRNLGFQSLVAFLGANDGMPKNEENGKRFRNMVVTLTSGAGKNTVNGIWDDQYQYLKMPDIGLVAKPGKGKAKGYFGPGGTRLKSKVK
jgi:hypothetical protein